MQVITALMILLLLQSAECRRARNGITRNRARGKWGTAKRSAANDCKDYVEAGDKFLDCQDKHLTHVFPGWPDDTVHMLLARNKIRILRDNTFVQFEKLKSLDLQQNDIRVIEEHAFSGLNKLTTLLLQHNQLQVLKEQVLIALPQLRYLRIYDNPWSCKCELDSLVRMLQVPSNRNLGNYAQCAEPANLKGRYLKKIKPELLCPELEVNITDEQIPEPVSAAKKEPDSTTCHTYMFPKPLLDCHSRDLKNVPANIPPDVARIDLSGNSIKQLRAMEFVAVKDLKMLNLSSNNLDYIDTTAFSGLLYLRELDLSNNSLQYFQYGVLEDLYFVQKLVLGNNPWKCDYNIHYLIYWLQHHYSVEYSGLICSSPVEFKGWLVEDYVKTYNGDCPKDKLPGQTDNLQETNADADDEEETDIQPSPIRGRERTIKIIRLS
ncbi:leucine-rich repeat-containing protein 17 [Lepisosteus oculatus]|nr:PREDICTED: leucine-rich repeat-containing protein 17 [Lepisosteus oculatus]